MRWLRHVFSPSAHARFPAASLDRIARAIAEGERRHAAQLMFAVESDLPLAALWRGVSPRGRAEHAFALLRTWDTRDNNGVLLYLLLADHAVEIVADRGLHGRIDAARWRQVCEDFGRRRREGDLEAAVLAAIATLSEMLAEHFPADPDAPRDNELPDRPRLLG